MNSPILLSGAGLIAGLTILAGAACSSGSTYAPADGLIGTAPTIQGVPPTFPGTVTISKVTQFSTAEIVKLVEPAVVRIQTNGGVGSGFVISEDGYIITNNHVIQGAGGRPAATIQVTLNDGDIRKATVVGFDARADLAVIKIEATNLKPLKLAALENAQVGDDVVAIGFALDLKRGEGPSFSVTRGIISAKNRGIDESASQILGAIQTDAAINHGNSGGPLLNLQGEVVGVNTAIAPDSSTGGIAPGIGFAVGSDTVKAVYEQIRANGRVNRGLLGLTGFEALRPAKARELGIPETVGGVYLDSPSDVATGGPAATAGIRGGDVITKIGKFALRNEADLAVAMIQNAPGTKVSIELYRDGKKLTVEVTLGTPQQ